MNENDRTIQYLSQIDLFACFEKAELNEIVASFPFSLNRFPRGAHFHESESPFHRQSFLCSGTIEGSVLSEQGKLLTLEKIFAPALIAPAAVFGTEVVPFSIEIVEDAVIVSIEKEAFFRLLLEKEKLLKRYIKTTSNRFIHVSRKLMFHSFHSIEKKLALYLLQLYRGGGVEFEMPHTITGLAGYFGVERPSLSVVFNRFIRSGYIRRVRESGKRDKKIEITDIAALQNIVFPG